MVSCFRKHGKDAGVFVKEFAPDGRCQGSLDESLLALVCWLCVSCDTDVAEMIARYAGSVLGLFAFSVTVVAGLVVQNPIAITLERGVFALFLFCMLGFILGSVAQMVVREFERSREAEILQRYELPPVDTEVAPTEAEASLSEGELTGA